MFKSRLSAEVESGAPYPLTKSEEEGTSRTPYIDDTRPQPMVAEFRASWALRRPKVRLEAKIAT